MVSPAEVYGGISAFKSMYEMAKALKDIGDATKRNVAIIDLTEQILSAYAEQSLLLEKVRTLEAEKVDFETWNSEKQKYELKNLGVSAFAYMLKPDSRGSKPPHWVCEKCYSDGKVYIIQSREKDREDIFSCPNCKTVVEPSAAAFEPKDGGLGAFSPNVIRWLD